MERLLKAVDTYQTFTPRCIRLERQLSWLVDLEQLLDPSPRPPETSPTSAQVADQVDRYLRDLRQQTGADPEDARVAEHIDRTFRNRWWGLFRCYDIPGLPRTNNGLEVFLGRLKTRQRRITGHKSTHDFIMRYGCFVAFVDHNESKADLLQRLSQVDRVAYQRERRRLGETLLKAAKIHRFRHRPAQALTELENRWAQAVEAAAQQLVGAGKP